MRAAWNNTAVALTDVDGNKAMTLTTASGWNGLQFNFAGTGDIGSANDYQNCFAVRVKITAKQPATLTAKLTRWENGIEKKSNLVAGENVIVAYFTDLKGTALSDYTQFADARGHLLRNGGLHLRRRGIFERIRCIRNLRAG